MCMGQCVPLDKLQVSPELTAGSLLANSCLQAGRCYLLWLRGLWKVQLIGIPCCILMHLMPPASVVPLLKGVLEKPQTIPWQKNRFWVQVKSAFSQGFLLWLDFYDVTQELALFLWQKKEKKFCFSPRFVGCSAWTSVSLTNLECFCFSGLQDTQINTLALKTVFYLQSRQNG